MSQVLSPPFEGGIVQPDGGILIPAGQPYMTVRTVTWQDMRRILADAEKDERIRQRPIRPSRVQRATAWIDSGEWEPVPPGLLWSSDGELLNGRHRGTAQVDRRVDLPWWVGYNIPRSLYALIDVLATRTLNDTLHIAGYAEDTGSGRLRVDPNLQSTVRLYLSIEKYREKPLSPWRQWWLYPRFTRQFEHTHVLRALERVPGLRESSALGHRVYKNNQHRINGPAFAVFHRWVLDVHTDEATRGVLETFTQEAGYGEAIQSGDPAYTFRQWAHSGRATGSPDHYKIGRERMLFGLLEAWNARVQGKPLRQITIPSGTNSALPLPERVPLRDIYKTGGRG